MAVNVVRKPIRLVHATSMVMVATFASAALGVLREALIAARFGASSDTDALFFTLALIVGMPDFMLAAISASLVPVYIHSKQEGHTALFSSTVINAYVLLLLGTTAVVLATASFSVPVLASGFDTAGRQLVVQLIWILSPTIVLAGLWGTLKTLLNAEGHFFVSNISTAFLSAGMIGAIILLPAQLGVHKLAIGVLVAAVGQVIWTGYWLWRDGFRYRFRLALNEPGFRRFLALLGPGVMGSALGYTVTIMDRSMASHLSEGSISALSYADRPMNVLTNIAVFSFVTALLPSLSEKSMNRDRASFKHSVSQTLGILLFVITPLSLLLAALRMPIIQLLFERGRFDTVATANTANVFGGYVLGLMPMAIAVTLSTMFNALEDTRTPAFFGAGSNLISKIVFNLVLMTAFGAAGLALATSMQYVVSGTILLFILRRRLQGIGGGYLLRTFSRVVLASLLAIIPAHLIATYSNMPAIVVIFAGMLVGSTVYVLASALLRAPELLTMYRYLVQSRYVRAFVTL